MFAFFARFFFHYQKGNSETDLAACELRTPPGQFRLFSEWRYILGAPGGSRTPNLGLRRASLYPLSYWGSELHYSIFQLTLPGVFWEQDRG
jgi:hypothetical protein